MAGASHTMRRLTSTPSSLAGGRSSHSSQGGPGFRQAVAHKQEDVGAHACLARRGQRDTRASFTHWVEIAQQRRRMHMLDDAADPFGERDRCSRPLMSAPNPAMSG